MRPHLPQSNPEVLLDALSPNLVALDLGRFHVPHGLVVVGGASLACVHHELGDRVDGDARDAADRAHGRPLHQHGEDLDAGFEGEFVHASTMWTFLLVVKHNISVAGNRRRQGPALSASRTPFCITSKRSFGYCQGVARKSVTPAS
jgi:hypothetical protein